MNKEIEILEMIRKFEGITGINFEGELNITGRLKTALGKTKAVYVQNTRTKQKRLYSLSIDINKKFLEVATDSEIYNVVGHEYAHYCCYITMEDHNHNSKRFKEYCNMMNVTSNTSLKIEKSLEKKYDVSCSCCGNILASYNSARSNVIKYNGCGFKSGCCKADLKIKKNW